MSIFRNFKTVFVIFLVVFANLFLSRVAFGISFYTADGSGSCSGDCTACSQFIEETQCAAGYIKDPIVERYFVPSKPEEQCAVTAGVCKKCDKGDLFLGSGRGNRGGSSWCMSTPYANNEVGNLAEQPRTKESGVSACISNPVNYVTGHKIETHSDYLGNGAFPLRVTRSYSSSQERIELDASAKHLPRWRFSFSGGLGKQLKINTFSELYAVRVVSNDGTVQWFVNVAPGKTDPNGAATYSTVETDVKSSLVRLADSAGWLLRVPDGRQYRFGLNTEIRKVVTRNGLSHTYNYDQNNMTITDDFGRVMVVTTDGSLGRGRVKSVTLPGESTIQYSYNTDGILETVTLADGSTRLHHYEQGPGLLTGITDERGIRYATFGYGENSALQRAYRKVLFSEHSGGVDRTEFVRDNLGGGVKIINPLGSEAVYSFTTVQGMPKLRGIDRQASAHCPDAASAYTYDTNGFLESTTDWNGNITRYQRNSRGLAETIVQAEGTAQERRISTTWHPLFRIPRIVTEPGRQTEYTFDTFDSPLYTGKIVTDLTTGLMRQWRYSYNSLGQVLTVDGPRTDVTDITTYQYHDCATGGKCGQLHTVTNALGHVVTYNAYDIHGNPVKITDANGVVTDLTYDLRQRLTSVAVDGTRSEILYDLTGKPKRLTQADGTFFEYVRDDANRLVGLFDGQGNSIDWILDDAGNRIDEKIKDAQGILRKRMQYKYDELSRLRKMIYAHGGEVSYKHDRNGNQTEISDVGNLGTDRLVESKFDELNRLIKNIDALSGETEYRYDKRDNLTEVTDAKGLLTRYSYNGFDELTQLESPDTGITSFTYDDAGNMKTVIDARGVTATYVYDALNRLISISYPDSNQDIVYTYDQGINGTGRLYEISDGSGSTIYDYDARGNVTSLVQVIGTSTYIQEFRYNSANRLIQATYPSGRLVAYSLDTSGQARDITSVSAEGTETLADSITRLPFGPVGSLRLGNGADRTRVYDQDYRVVRFTDGSVLNRGYAFNTVNNITAITDSVGVDQDQFFIYDELDRLDFASGGYGEDVFGYDAIGNRVSMSRDGQTQSYQYGASSHRLQGVGAQSYQYDAVGNITNNGVAEFGYNDRNRLASATVGGATTQYGHNALGQRVVKNGPQTQTHYLYDLEGRLIAEAIDGQVTVEYSYLGREPLTMWQLNDSSTLPAEPPPAPSLGAPVGNIDTGRPDYVWAHVATNTQYRLRIYDRTQRRWVLNEVFDSADVCSGESCSVTPELELPISRNHLGQLRARNVIGWSGWSAYSRFHVLPSLPEQPLLFSPQGDIDTGSPSYQWSYQEGVTQYRLQIYDRIERRWVFNQLRDPGLVCNDGICQETPVVILPDSPNHMWRVRARNLAGWSAWSARSYFHVTVANEPESLLENGGFESGLDSWLSCSDEGSTRIVTDSAEGAKAAELLGGGCLYQEFVITPGGTYVMSCQATGGQSQYADVSLSLMDDGYTLLESQEVSISSAGYQPYSQSLTAPETGAIGALTLYSEDTSTFDDCSVVEG